MSDEHITTDIVISTTLVDRIAGMMVLLQKADPASMLYEIDNLKKLAGQIQTELQAIRGPWVVCHLCSPARRLEMKDVKKHDIEVHHAYKG